MAEKNLASKEITVSKKYDLRARLAIASEIIEYIRDRSSKGLGPGKAPFNGEANSYTKGYYNSLDFKNAKGRSKKVTMALSGDMLAEIEALKGTDTDGKIEIGYSMGSSQHGKAEGNIIGSYGREPNKSKARPFLTLTKPEIEKILKKFPLDNPRKLDQAVLSREDAIANVAGDITFDEEMED